MRTRLLSIAIALAVPATASAQNLVSLRVSQSFIPSSSFDALSPNDHLVQAELAYARRLLPLRAGALWLEGSYLVGTAKADLFAQSLRTKTLIQSVMFSALYRVPLYRWLVPRARVGAGVLWGSLELGGAAGEVSDRAAGFSGQLLVGVELLLPRRSATSVTGGLVVEGGYGLSTALRFKLAPERDDELRTIPLVGVDLGSVGLSGGLLRVGAVLRF
jgi:hypothetical protein